MAWIKRNLFFAIGGMVALGLLGWAGYYNYQGWSHNESAFTRLNEIYSTLRDLTKQDVAHHKFLPGNEKVDNIKAAKEQETALQEWIQQATGNFKSISPIPNTGTNAITSEAFAGALRRTVDQLQREADAASVSLPPKYTFSFAVETTTLRLDEPSLPLLAEQLGEVKAIAEVFFAVRVNSLDGIQRVRVSSEDIGGSQADYIEDHSLTNNLAVLTPYQISFRSFSPEVADVLARLATSPNGFVVKSISVQPAGAYSPTAAGTPGFGGEGAPPPPPPPVAVTTPLPLPGRGGLQTILNEQLLRVTLVVDIVKLLPKK